MPQTEELDLKDKLPPQNFDVFVQVLGVSGRTGASEWVTVGKVEKPESYDLLYLKGLVTDFIKKSDFKTHANAARLKFVHKGKTVMKATLTDLW